MPLLKSLLPFEGWMPSDNKYNFLDPCDIFQGAGDTTGGRSKDKFGLKRLFKILPPTIQLPNLYERESFSPSIFEDLLLGAVLPTKRLIF